MKPATRIEDLYRELPYLDAYAAHTDLRVEADPQQAVGGSWDRLGKQQLDFLIRHGLEPHHHLLDIGCGTLRAGRFFIRYLDEANYTGLEISARAIEFAQTLIQDEDLVKQRPRLVLSANKRLCFEEFEEPFDYLLAHSVFTHLKPEHIEECVNSIARVMHKDTVFFFTYNEATAFVQTGIKDFRYPESFFISLAENHGFELQDHSKDFGHPRGQRMMSLRMKP